jgi:hypothetical protein
MKLKTFLLATLLTAGCATQQTNRCVLLKFPQTPAPALVETLAQTQPAADAPAVRAWFAHGETGFLLSATHTNAIAQAVAAGATATTLHAPSSGLHLNNFRKR